METWIYVILAVIFWGLAPIFGKLGLVKIPPLLAISVRSFGISVILMVVLLLSGQLNSLRNIEPRAAGFILAEGIFAGLLGHFAYYYALSVGEVSRIVLLVRAAPVFTVLLGVLVLGESLSLVKVGGMTLIVVGAILMSL
jgi:transporter family protein